MVNDIAPPPSSVIHNIDQTLTDNCRLDGLDVAIVHDYLNQRGGAERVALALSDLWPSAPIYTSLYRSNSTFPEFRNREVRTTALDRIPVDRRFRTLLPLYAPAFTVLSPIDADVVIASSSAWAHHARVTRRALHVVYCHTPARWLIGDQRSSSSLAHGVARATFPALRRLDRLAARRPDVYLANSRNVQKKILDAYGINAEILHPPVDTSRFTATARGERLLAVSRLLPYKRLDLVIRASAQAGVGLDIVGDGPSLQDLKRIAGSNVAFHRALPDYAVTNLIESCWAVCVPAEDDFGIVSVEAQAAGKPVIAFRAGGALETVVEGVTGVFFDRQDTGSLVEALARLDDLRTSPLEIARYARAFSQDSFGQKLKQILAAHLAP